MLSVQNLCCRRSGRIVFRDLETEVKAGGFLLVTGANGSGKSSFLRILAGLLEPLSGEIFWQKSPVALDPTAHRARLHYTGHLDALKPNLTVTEMLAYWRALQGVGREAADAAFEAFDLAQYADCPVRVLSAGQKCRLSLTRLILSPAALWLLDEPTSSLDGASQKRLFTLIARHRAEGGIVIAAMHEILAVPDVQPLDMGFYARAGR